MKQLKHILISIDKLKPAKYNPRVELQPGDEEYEKIKNSIEKFGYAESIVVNKDLTVISGHQRLNVLKNLGYKEIEVAQVNLSKKEEKALNVALNKITGQWDEAKLADLFADLKDDDFNLDLTGFDSSDIQDLFADIEDDHIDDGEEEIKENARMNTMRAYNLELYDEYDSEGFYNMPIIRNDGYIPKKLIGFNYAMTSNDSEASIHCFIDDYQFERLWNSPEQYLDVLGKFECILSPDFSLYMDMPMAMKVWNIYRSRLLGNYWQRNGITVIPTISWAEPETFQFCFDGIPKGRIVAVSTIGVKRAEESFKVWKDGMNEMIKRIEPSNIIVYGGKVEFDYPEDIEIKYFDNEVTERMKKIGG